MIVVDASAVIEALLRSERGVLVEQHLLTAASSLHAPDLVDVEVLSGFRRMTFSKDLAVSRAQRALAVFGELRLRRWSTQPLRDRIWALRQSIAPYDAAYVTLAERLGCPLLTCDRRLAGATGHRATIQLV